MPGCPERWGFGALHTGPRSGARRIGFDSRRAAIYEARFRRALGSRERACRLTHPWLSSLARLKACRRSLSAEEGAFLVTWTDFKRNRDDEARGSEVQDRSPDGREHLGAPSQPL